MINDRVALAYRAKGKKGNGSGKKLV